MTHVSSSPRVRVSGARDVHGVARVALFKVDHPRAIDEYIDFFGTSTSARGRGAVAPGGESLIESLLERDCA